MVFAKLSSVSAYGGVETVSPEYIKVTLNDLDQQHADYIVKTLAQRKIDRFIGDLLDKADIVIERSKDIKGQSYFICEPLNLVVALFNLSEEFDYQNPDSNLREQVKNNVDFAHRLTIHAQQLEQFSPMPPIQ
ncbi:MAG: hypothetical protein AAF988_00515 [Pseudomonadota bacterium]